MTKRFNRSDQARLSSIRPRDRQQLQRTVRRLLNLRVPDRPIVEGNSAPMDYLAHAFFESHRDASAGDCVVWASRGGGKTMLGAAATLLDLLFKPGIQVRILGGSFEQSSKMYRYLHRMVTHRRLRFALASEPTLRRIALANGSEVEVLSQSHRSVRGTRVHKLRCDEVDEFRQDVWDAAQLVTRSGMCGPVAVRGAVEALSTMHRPFGLMHKLVTPTPDQPRVKVFRWCVLDVIERCPPRRDCATCPLWDDCRGRARSADGFMKIDDVVQQRLRSSDAAWASEMLCRRPRVADNVYPQFDATINGRHVVEAMRPLQAGDEAYGGMDFGLRNPLVMLWARLLPGPGGVQRRVLEIVDEYVATDLTLGRNLDAIARRTRLPLRWLGVDPAGGQRNAHSGLTDLQVLRRRGHVVRARLCPVRDGIERIRRRLDQRTLRIHSRCRRLVHALATYHFDTQRPHCPRPIKDGPDHLCDALRYLVVNLEYATAEVTRARYA